MVPPSARAAGCSCRPDSDDLAGQRADGGDGLRAGAEGALVRCEPDRPLAAGNRGLAADIRARCRGCPDGATGAGSSAGGARLSPCSARRRRGRCPAAPAPPRTAASHSRRARQPMKLAAELRAKLSRRGSAVGDEAIDFASELRQALSAFPCDAKKIGTRPALTSGSEVSGLGSFSRDRRRRGCGRDRSPASTAAADASASAPSLRALPRPPKGSRATTRGASGWFGSR